MTSRTYNGVPKREYVALCKLEKELFYEWKMNLSDIDAHNRFRGVVNVVAMCQGDAPRLDLITSKSSY